MGPALWRQGDTHQHGNVGFSVVVSTRGNHHAILWDSYDRTFHIGHVTTWEEGLCDWINPHEEFGFNTFSEAHAALSDIFKPNASRYEISYLDDTAVGVGKVFDSFVEAYDFARDVVRDQEFEALSINGPWVAQHLRISKHTR